MKYLIHILFIVCMFVLFFTHPHVVEGMFGLIFGLFALAIVFMAYASWRQKQGHPIRGVTITSSTNSVPEAFVGLQGQGIGLATENRDGKLRIRLSSASYILILVICFIFGPGMIGAYQFHGPNFRWNAPWFAIAGIVGMVGISTVLFLYYLRIVLWDMPVIEATPEGIRLMRGVTQEAFIKPGNIAKFDIRVSQFIDTDSSTNRTIDNYTLCAVLKDGTEKGLCIGSDKGQLETLKNGLAEMLNPAA